MAYEKKPVVDIDKDTSSYSGQSKPVHPGKRGDHPLGGAVGAAAGAVVATSVVAGAVAGPIGVIAGAEIGGVVGALIGKGVAQAVNPTTGDAKATAENARAQDLNAAEPSVRSDLDLENKPEDNVTLPWDKPAARGSYEEITERTEIIEDDIDTDIDR